MKKTTSICLLLIIIICSLALNGCADQYDYERPKKAALDYLAENESELIELFERMLEAKPEFPNDSGEYNGNYYSYEKTDTTEYVTLDMDAQGMLGGQYWGLIYCPTNDLIANGADIEIYDEREKDTGNNVFIKQKLKDGWYFYYVDYDGHVDVSKIVAN